MTVVEIKQFAQCIQELQGKSCITFEPKKSIDADNKKNKDMENGLHQIPCFYIFAAFSIHRQSARWALCDDSSHQHDEKKA